MNLDDLKDQLNEKLTAAWGELQENSTFNTLRERYQTLSSNAQKGVQVGAALLVLLILIYIPFSYFSSSSTYVEDFEANRSMIRSLLEASRNSRLPPPLPAGQDPERLANRVKMVLGGFRLLPEQIGEVETLANNPAGGLVPPSIQQAGVAVQLKTLNLTQVMEIGQRLQSLDSGTKLVGMEIQASKAKKDYLDVVFRIVNFSLNLQTEEPPANSRSRRGGAK